MRANILVTGAAGYIGGSIVAAFSSSSNKLLKDAKIIASVRSEKQLKALQSTGVEAIQLDLSNESDVLDAVLSNEGTILAHSHDLNATAADKPAVNIVIHAANSIDPALAKPLITALARRQSATGAQAHFIHTSALSAFYPSTGWPAHEFNDTDDVFVTEKSLAESFPVRSTDVAVVELAKELGVKSYIVVPSTVYGKGTGAWNQLSVVLPVFVSAALAQKRVSKFPENTTVAAVHISDQTALYANIVEKILAENAPENGEKGYYFALAHYVQWHKIAAKLASAMKARGLVDDDNTSTWANAEDAAEVLGVPVMFVQALWNSGANIVAHNEERLGWKPKWTEEQFFAHIDDEVQAVVDLGKAKSSLIESLHQAARG